LFDEICGLPEYYLTRCELEIMRRQIGRMAEAIGPGCCLIEYGSGSSLKTRVLLDHLQEPAAYVPIDISHGHLMRAARSLRGSYPGLAVLPVCADYTREFALPECPWCSRKVVYFPGSTVGNFTPDEARGFLQGIGRRIGGGLLIGVDLKKDPRVLHAAYNDSAGVTARFNLNLLGRINRELDGNFDLERFAHYAFYNPRLGRIEMHLVSAAAQSFHAAGELIHFRSGESIFTESSYKYSVEDFQRLASDAGYRLREVWVDEDCLFSVQYLTVE
jgi:dimethylhistidine N-methyltransferase